MNQKPKTERGRYGEKMIRFSVKFWTNELPKGAKPKTAWESGVITILSNKSKGINSKEIFFRDLEDFPKQMQKLMDDQKIILIEAPKKKLKQKKFV